MYVSERILEQKMKILLLGDVCPTQKTNENFKKGDLETLFSDTKTLFEGKDIAFINLECALTDSENRIKKFGPNLKGCKETAQALKKLGVTVCGLSNNHIFDFGKEGAIDTLRALDEAGLDYTGFGNDYEDSRRDYVVEKDGETVCFIAVCEHEYSYALDDRMGSRPFDPFDSIIDIRRAKDKYDKVIVIYHGGKEHCRYPSPRLYKAAHAMAEAGADVVVGQHSHCISCYEQYNGCHIFYGQGNFNFMMPGAKVEDGWGSCLALEYDTADGNVTFTPIVEYGDCGVEIAKGDVAKDMLRGFAERNESLQNGEWLIGWNKFAESMREYYTGIVSNAFVSGSTETQDANFAHYLDCEAHTDVWRELFPTYNLTNEK